MSLVAGSIVVKMEGDVKDLAKASKEARDEVGSISKTAEKSDKGFKSMEKVGKVAFGGLVLAAAGVTTAIGAITVQAFQAFDEVNTSQRKLSAQLNLTAEEAEAMGDVVKNVYKNNFGGSITEVSDAVFTVKQSLRDLTDEQVQFVTESAFALQDAYQQPIEKTTDAVDALMVNFGLSSTEAVDMIANGFQAGLDTSGDFLDTITEYSVSFGEGEASADQFFNIIASGSQNGVLGTDKIADSFKEFMIRVRDGSEGTREAFETLGYDYDGLMQDLANGTVTGIDLFDLLSSEVNHIGDTVTQQEVGVALFGTMYEDLGTKAFKAVDSATDMWSRNGDAIGKVQEQYGSFNDIWNDLYRDIVIGVSEGFTPLEKVLLDTYNFLIANPDILNSVLAGLGGIAAALTFAMVPALLGAAGAAWAFMAPFLPFVAIAVAIGAAVAGLAYLWNTNFLGIKDVTMQLWGVLMSFLQPALDQLKAAWDNLMNALTPVFQMVMEFLLPALVQLWDFLKPVLIPILGVLAAIMFGPILAAFAAVVGGIYALAAIFNWIADVVRNNMEFIKSYIDGFKKNFDSLLANAYKIRDGMKNAFKQIAEGIGNSMKTAANSIVDNINIAIEAVNGITSALKVVPGAPSVPQIPKIPRFARGVENFEGGLATINEGGIKEALNIGDTLYLPAGTDVINGEETAEMMSGSTFAPQISLSFNGFMGTAKDRRRLTEELETELERLWNKFRQKPA